MDQDIVDGARGGLAAADIHNVEVILGDGAVGHAPNAPYDRIEATVGAHAVPHAWLDQLAPGGRLLTPLRLRGSVSRSIAFEHQDGAWRSVGSQMNTFMPLCQGIADDPRVFVPLGPDNTVTLVTNGDQKVDPDALSDIFRQPRTEVWTDVTLRGPESPARTLCWRHAEVFLRALPLSAQEARYALEPLVNLARLRIRGGDGNSAYHLLDSMNRAVKSKTDAVIDGRVMPFSRLTQSASGHQQVCQWLWTVLVAAGQWDLALAHAEQHRGVGKRLFDGRQVEVVVHCLGGQPSEALEFLNESTLIEDWEHSVAACLTVLCHTAADENPVGAAETMVKHYLDLGTNPELAVFRIRVGLAVLDLSPHIGQAEASRRLVQEAATSGDGYVARDVSIPGCQSEVSHSEFRTLSAAVAAAGLGQGQFLHLWRTPCGTLRRSPRGSGNATSPAGPAPAREQRSQQAEGNDLSLHRNLRHT